MGLQIEVATCAWGLQGRAATWMALAPSGWVCSHYLHEEDEDRFGNRS